MLSENTHAEGNTAQAGMPAAGPEPSAGRPPDPSRGSLIYLVVTLGALAVLVWALRPDQPKVQPAALGPPADGCPHLAGQFTPTNITDVPGLDLAGLRSDRRNRVLLRLNMELCPCGCNASVADCLVRHRQCAKCKERAQKILAEER